MKLLVPWENAHHYQPALRGLFGIKAVYEELGLIPTSTAADTVLIRSHIAYWSGDETAELAVIKPSRGHSYRVTIKDKFGTEKVIVTISDHMNHELGVQGWRGR